MSMSSMSSLPKKGLKIAHMTICRWTVFCGDLNIDFVCYKVYVISIHLVGLWGHLPMLVYVMVKKL